MVVLGTGLSYTDGVYCSVGVWGGGTGLSYTDGVYCSVLDYHTLMVSIVV